MKSGHSNLNTEASEADFRRLLQDIRARRVPADVLFEDQIFKTRVRLITMTLAQTAEDAQELANDVHLKVSTNLQHFKPNYDRPYGNFFSWVRRIAQNAFIDSLRWRNIQVHEQRPEDLDIADTETDIERSFLYKEVLAEFEKSINALPDRERLAIAYYLQGFSFREISKKMLEAGFSSSHVMVSKWIREALSAYFQKSGNLKNIGSKNVKVTKVRATRAKREFYTILEHAINSGTAGMSEDIHRTSLAAVVKPESSKTTQLTSHPGWQSANDLLKSMQSPESKRGIEAAFEASPEALGQAAVEHANKGRKIPLTLWRPQP